MNIGIDHGYYAIKTRHFSFPAGVAVYSHEPYTLQNALELEGRYFVCGTGRQPILRDKTENDNYYYEDDFAGAKRDFAVRSGLISNASLFSKEELTELYRATEHLLAEDPDLNDKQMKAIQEARTKIEFSVPDLDTQLEHRQDSGPQMEM